MVFSGDSEFGPNPFESEQKGGKPNQSRQGDVHWRLTTVEKQWEQSGRNFTVTGQFPLGEGIKYRTNNVIAEAGGFGLPFPFVQWIKGELEKVSFMVTLYSRNKDEDINQIFKQMKRLKDHVPELNRAPLCRFTFGSVLSLLVLVDGFGDVDYSQLKPDGTARKIEFGITLSRFRPFIRFLFDNKPPKLSRNQQVTGQNRMYEQLAIKQFGTGNAIFGDVLRKLNRSSPFAAKDESVVKIPNADFVLSQEIEPEFHGFRFGDEDVQAMIRRRFERRNQKVLVISKR